MRDGKEGKRGTREGGRERFTKMFELSSLTNSD